MQKSRHKKPKKTSKKAKLPPVQGFKTEVEHDEQETQGKRVHDWNNTDVVVPDAVSSRLKSVSVGMEPGSPFGNRIKGVSDHPAIWPRE